MFSGNFLSHSTGAVVSEYAEYLNTGFDGVFGRIVWSVLVVLGR
jgi:hypothetical protein